MSYVTAAKELPKLSDEEVEAMNNEFGIGSGDSHGSGGSTDEVATEKGAAQHHQEA